METRRNILPSLKQFSFPSSGNLLIVYFFTILLLTVFELNYLLILMVIVSTVYGLLKIISSHCGHLEAKQIFIEGRISTTGGKYHQLLSGYSSSSSRKRRDKLEMIERYHAKLGKTFGMLSGNDAIVFTTDLDLIHRLFLTEDINQIDDVQWIGDLERRNSLVQMISDEVSAMKFQHKNLIGSIQLSSDINRSVVSTYCNKLINDHIQNHPIHLGGRIIDIHNLAQKYVTEFVLISSDHMFENELIFMQSGKGKRNSFTDNLIKSRCETTANTLTCLFWSLVKNQSAQEKLRDSLDRSETGNSHYLEWCIKETLRLYPAVSTTTIGCSLSKNISYDDRKLFKGTTINASIYSIHRSREYWGEDELDFRPDRFDEQLYGQLHPFQYMPFALSTRDSTNRIDGSTLVDPLRAMIKYILLRYKLEMCKETPTNLMTHISVSLEQNKFDSPVEMKLTEMSSL